MLIWKCFHLNCYCITTFHANINKFFPSKFSCRRCISGAILYTSKYVSIGYHRSFGLDIW
ncbi:unnamed protein product [Enterobius vermicularis]|uniref:Uncharacterized protein n=1 Tax=Enterobius vermicularis TaxID=51028 RepID=A0A0N4VRP1_ENTVE|nr:unnamed protein product [Enterobius vermicularis]